MNSNITSVQLYDIEPDSIRNDENVSAASSSIDTQLHAVASKLDFPLIYTRIDSLTSLQLDHLARQWDAVWRDYWDIAKKRLVLKTTINLKRKVGTLSAVKDAVASLSFVASVVEWWQPEATSKTAHTFEIVVSQNETSGAVAADVQADMKAMVDSAKPVRSWYTISIQDGCSGTLNMCGVMRTGIYARISHLGA